ncbi:MAG: ankyrin repeat domain-containing protein, partial [Gammaproteobacteria bacterium]
MHIRMAKVLLLTLATCHNTTRRRTMKQLKLMLTAIFAAFGRLFTFRAAQGGGGNFNFGRAFGAVCLSAILAIGNVAFAGNAAFTIGERQATHTADGRIDIAYDWNRNSYWGMSKKEINEKRGGDGWTHLHEEAARDHIRFINELVRGGADLEIKTTTRGWTALHVAADRGHHVALGTLLGARAKIDPRDKEGRTPLHLAAAKSGNFFVVQTLLDTRFRRGKPANVNAKDKKGRTPLHLAVQAKRTKRHRILERLIDKGADINARDKDGRTPLHLAAEANKIGAVRFLIRKRANKNAKDNEGRTALEVAAYAGSTYVAKRLISEFKMSDSFVNKRAVYEERRRPLHRAAKNNNIKALKTL